MYFPVDVVRFFSPTAGTLFRAFDHLVGSRDGMTLMVPLSASFGKLGDFVDQCPVPHLEATAILDANYGEAARLDFQDLVGAPMWARIHNFEPLAAVAKGFADRFLGDYGIHTFDQDWRHIQIRLSAGGQPCRVLIGRRGVRLAFTPDFFEGVL
jgi:hypothetical protein